MATRIDPKSKASPAMIGIAVIVALAFIGWLAYANLFAPPKTPPMSPQQQQALNHYDELAKRTHGDINNLPPDEREKFLQETGGHGAGILQGIARQKGY